MQCEPESIRKRFATVVQVLAAVGVVSVATKTLWRRPFASEILHTIGEACRHWCTRPMSTYYLQRSLEFLIVQ
jgi:hypothetical protein